MYYSKGVNVFGGFPKIRGTFLGVPRIRIILFGGVGVYVGVPLFRKTTIYAERPLEQS